MDGNNNMFQDNIISPFLGKVQDFGTYNAFCINDKFYTYNDFAQYISKIRKALQTSERKGLNIGLVVNDDIETYASIFAIWFEGCAYVPLHPLQPIERNSEIIHQADIYLIIDSSFSSSFKDVAIIESGKLRFDELNLHPNTIPDEVVAYILFTSGSTGKPKGVPITRGNIGQFLKSFFEVGFHIDEKDRCLQCFDLTFDVSVQSFLVPLTRGACTYTIPHNQIKYSYIFGLFEEHKLTFGAMAPSMVRYLRPYFEEISVPSMRYNILTAEASPIDLINEWSICIPNAEIYDFYGPTEATIYCTYHKIIRNGENKNYNGISSIGKPLQGLKAIIIDDDKKILGAGQKGELCIAGGQVTPGYWKNYEKNKESFFEIFFEGGICRFYRTGDSCFKDKDGDIMYSGRLDYQVKIHGYRVELGEIEYYAREFLGGNNAVAVAFENTAKNTEIALFVEGELVDDGKLLKYLGSKLPYYMSPSKIFMCKKFPLNSNGKVDRNLLKNSINL